MDGGNSSHSTYKLIDKNIIEQYTFYPDGLVSATVGEVKYALRSGEKEVTESATLYYWEISANGELLIITSSQEVIKSLTLKDVQGDNYIVLSKGIKLVYKRSK